MRFQPCTKRELVWILLHLGIAGLMAIIPLLLTLLIRAMV
jgi:hypothetical protein